MKPPRSVKQKAESKPSLYEAFAAIQTAAEAEQLLADLCTPAELQAMMDRWRVVPLIKQGKPYREIYDLTGVSVTTVGRVARCLLLGQGGYDLIYNRLEKTNHANKSSRRNTTK